MVRTGRRASVLRELLVAAGWHPAPAPERPRLHELLPELGASISDLYASLGGQANPTTLRPGNWDIALEGGVVIELDEELHFNRYRLATLAPAWTESLPWRPTYSALCADHEGDCLAAGRWGKRWTNPSCEAHFGTPDRPGEFTSGGSPRWKQRAIYDAIKDAACLSDLGLQLARVATHDRVGHATLGAVLDGAAGATSGEVAEFVRSRTFRSLDS